MRRNLILILAFLFIAIVLCSCGGGSSLGGNPNSGSTPVSVEDGPVVSAGWPASLPTDGVQPWETVNAQGYVVPAANSRLASAITTTSEFTPGRERFQEAGSVADNGEASTLTAGPAVDNFSWAMYRISMAGIQPGAVSIDANLLPRPGAGSASEYYVGLSDYVRGAWAWHGPFSDAQIRLALEPGDWLSPLGNLFATVVVFEDSAIDLVGIGVNPADAGDVIAPPTPAALAATPVQGGLLLEWTPSAAGDLAGYQIYWSYSPISDPSAAGVNKLSYLEGNTSHVLPVNQIRTTYARVSALDVSGNESALSPEEAAVPLSGTAAEVLLTTDVLSGAYGLSANLAAVGADVYDWDLDGDGVFDITDDPMGAQTAVLMQPGIIRPAVRGRNTGGTSVACGAVSLIVTGNTRPAASCVVTPSQGQAPLTVTYAGDAYDAEDQPADLRYSWDINGDGIYVGSGSWNSLSPPNGTYTTGGLYNVKFRVEDSAGAWDVDSMAVQVEESTPVNQPPTASCTPSGYTFDALPVTVRFNPSASNDPDGTIVKYEWDFDGDYSYDSVSYSDITISHTFTQRGRWSVGLLVTDNDGAASFISTTITCGGGWLMEGGNPYRTHYQYLAGPTTSHQAYAVDISTAVVNATPVISDEGFIYVLDSNNDLFSLYSDLTVRWTKSLPSTSTGLTGVALDQEGNVYAVDADGYCICYTPEGSTIWIRDLSTNVNSRPLIDPERQRVYVLSFSGILYCLNSKTGSPIWTSPYSAGQNTYETSPTLDPDGNIYFGDEGGNLHAVNPDGSSLAWAPYVTGISWGISSSPAYDAWTRSIVFCVSDSSSSKGVVFKVSVVDGSLVWSATPGETGSTIDASPALDEFGNVFIGTWDNKVYGLDTYDGTALTGWPVTLGGDIDSCDAVIDTGNRVYVGSWDKQVYCFSPGGALEWVSAVTADAFAASLAIGPGGNLYAINISGEMIVFDGQ